jgi:hypothetical protein
MAELIASSTNTATSADFTLTDGQSTTLFLKDAEGTKVHPNALASVQIQSSGGQYFEVGILDDANPARVLQAPGVFRVVKFSAERAYGVDRV